MKMGSSGAYCSAYEKEACVELLKDTMDVMADKAITLRQRLIAEINKHIWHHIR